MNILSVHWIPQHRGPEDRERFARWQPRFIKIVMDGEKVPYLEDMPEYNKIVVRNHPLSEMNDKRGFNDSAHARAVGLEHANYCRLMADNAKRQGVPDSRLLFEGLNEPQLWAGEPQALLNTYYGAFLHRLHEHGLRGVVGNFGVGWPGNGGVHDAPPEWKFFKPTIDAMLPGDYLGLHEYWALEGPQQNWRWWGGRFLQCPYRVPILITECGIDTGVTGNWYGGWGDLPGSFEEKAARYAQELDYYARQCAADGRVHGIFPFTYDIGSREWERFNVRNESLLNALWPVLDGLATLPDPPAVIPDPPAVVPQSFGARLCEMVGAAKYADLRPLLNGSYAIRPLAQIERIIVHHTVGSQAAQWEAIAVDHERRGWPGIGYHIGIDGAGNVAYLGDINTHRYHAGDANANSIGVALAGNFDVEYPSAEALWALGAVTGALWRHLGRDIPTVGHCDVGATACPGRNLYASLMDWDTPDPPDEPDLPAPEPSTTPLPEHETATDAATLAQKVRWWTEESLRQQEAASATLRSLVKLLYRLEAAIK